MCSNGMWSTLAGVCSSQTGRWAHGEDVRAALVMAWEASDRICGKRLQPLLAPLIEATERHGHAGISSGAREQSLVTSRPRSIAS
jgi:hypothetical protein